MGFNALKVIMDAQKNAYALVKMFSMLFKSSNTDHVKTFIHLIQKLSDDKQTLVRVKSKNVIVPAGRTVQVPCIENIGSVKEIKVLLFQ